MTTTNSQFESGQDLGYGQIFAVIWRRRALFLGAFLMVLPISSIFILTRSPVYQSSLQLLVEPNFQGKRNLTEEAQTVDRSSETDYATQLSLLRSTKLINRAVDLLQSQYPDITVGEIAGSLVLTQLAEEDGTSTRIFQAQYIADDAAKAQAVLEAMQKVYQDYNLEQQKLRLRNGLLFIDEQLPAVASDVSEAEGALQKFRESENILDPTSQGESLSGALAEVRAERQALAAQFEEATARFNELQTQVGNSIQGALNSARLSQSTRYQELLKQIQTVDLAIAQRSVTFTDNDPGLMDLDDQRQKLLELLKTEAQLTTTEARSPESNNNQSSRDNLSAIDVALVEEYVAARSTLIGLVSRDRSLEQSEQQLTAQLSKFPSLIAEYNRLQPTVDVKRASLEELLKARQDLSIELARGGFNWQVIESPQLGAQINSNRMRDLLLGTVIALFLGGIAAFLHETIDDSIHTADQLGESSGLPLLGTVPEISQKELAAIDRALSSVMTPAITCSQAFRESLALIYKNIQLIIPTANSIAVTSALPNEGKTTVALGLALSAARSHKRVLLIDADLRQPSLHEQFRLPNHKGLSNLLDNDFNTIKRHRVALSNCDIDVLTSGPIPYDSLHLLSSGRFQQILQWLTQHYDQVIIDAPPLNGLVDAVQISSSCQGVVMVGRLHQISKSELLRSIKTLNRLPTIGIVANGSREVPKGLSSYNQSMAEQAVVKYEHLEKEQAQNQQSYS